MGSWVHTICKSTTFSKNGPRYRLQYLYWIESVMHLKGFKRRGREGRGSLLFEERSFGDPELHNHYAIFFS
jgi:hypothetical protein